MARCLGACVTEPVKRRELFLNNILYVDSVLDLTQLTRSLLAGRQAGLPGGLRKASCGKRPRRSFASGLRRGRGRPSESTGEEPQGACGGTRKGRRRASEGIRRARWRPSESSWRQCAFKFAAKGVLEGPQVLKCFVYKGLEGLGTLADPTAT